MTQADADAVLARLDTVDRDGQLDFEEFTAAFQHMAAHEIDVSCVIVALIWAFLIRKSRIYPFFL